MLNLPLFFRNFQWRIYWILFQNTYITFLITHPAPLISIHSNSANTHGRGCAGTGPRETHGRFRTSLGQRCGTVLLPPRPHYLDLLAADSGVTAPGRAPCSPANGERWTVFQVPGLSRVPAAAAAATVPARSACQLGASAAAGSAASALAGCGARGGKDLAKLTSSRSGSPFPTADFSVLSSTPFFDG